MEDASSKSSNNSAPLQRSIEFQPNSALSSLTRYFTQRTYRSRNRFLGRRTRKAHQNTSRHTVSISLGLVRRRQGQIVAARSHFQTAIQLAKECGDHKRAAWASLQLFRALAESEPAAAIGGMLPEIRNCVARAGDVQISAYLHDSIALMEVSNGRSRRG